MVCFGNKTVNGGCVTLLSPTTYIVNRFVEQQISEIWGVIKSKPCAAGDYDITRVNPRTKFGRVTVDRHFFGRDEIISSAPPQVKAAGYEFIESNWFVGHVRPLYPIVQAVRCLGVVALGRHSDAAVVALLGAVELAALAQVLLGLQERPVRLAEPAARERLE